MEERAEVVALAEPGPGRISRHGAQGTQPDNGLPGRSETGLDPPGHISPWRMQRTSIPRSSWTSSGNPASGGADRYGNYIGGGASASSPTCWETGSWARPFGSGTLKDIGGQVFYLNRKNRLNWGFAGVGLPYQYLQYGFGLTPGERTPEIRCFTKLNVGFGLRSTPRLGFWLIRFDDSQRIEADSRLYPGTATTSRRTRLYDQDHLEPTSEGSGWS